MKIAWCHKIITQWCHARVILEFETAANWKKKERKKGALEEDEMFIVATNGTRVQILDEVDMFPFSLMPLRKVWIYLFSFIDVKIVEQIGFFSCG